jgi:transcriptional accessory protein Tex/SPT6
MKLKDANTIKPSKYRSITCLQTLYKILTSCIACQIYLHCIIAEEQKGCRKLSQGCKEQLLIDSTVSEQAKHQKHNLYTAYIDYKKAFDSVPQKWLL